MASKCPHGVRHCNCNGIPKPMSVDEVEIEIAKEFANFVTATPGTLVSAMVHSPEYWKKAITQYPAYAGYEKIARFAFEASPLVKRLATYIPM